jgi:hypothetical protein
MNIECLLFGICTGLVLGVIIGITLFARFSTTMVDLVFRRVGKVYYGDDWKE